MKEVLKERSDAVQRALGETRLRTDALEAQLAQARRECDQMTGALLELKYLMDQLQPPEAPEPDQKAPE